MNEQELNKQVEELKAKLEATNEQLELSLAEAASQVTEARGIAFADFHGYISHKDGKSYPFEISVTARSGIGPYEAAMALIEAARKLKEINLFPYKFPYQSGTQESKPEQAPAKAAPAQPTQGNTPPAASSTPGAPVQQPAQGGIPSGTGKLKSITIDADLKASFNVEGLKWPLKDGRGAQVIAKLFDPELDWTAEHFVAPCVYTEVQLGKLFLDWEKPDKYYNVKYIHA